jgi:hypothetical protein
MKTDSLPTTEQKPPKLRWCQWRLRSLFLLTLLVGIGMGWLTVTIQGQRRQDVVAQAIWKAGGIVKSEPTWLGKLLRDDSLVNVTAVALIGEPTTDDGLENLQGLSQLQDLWLDSTQVTDVGLMHLQGLSQLRKLTLSRTKVTDEGVNKLQQALPNCKIDR